MNTFWSIPYFVWALGCLLIAVAYFIFIPKEAESVNLPLKGRFIVKYAHSIVWLLLAFSCILANDGQAIARFVALMGLFTYLIFIITFIKIKVKDKKSKVSHLSKNH